MRIKNIKSEDLPLVSYFNVFVLLLSLLVTFLSPFIDVKDEGIKAYLPFVIPFLLIAIVFTLYLIVKFFLNSNKSFYDLKKNIEGLIGTSARMETLQFAYKEMAQRVREGKDIRVVISVPYDKGSGSSITTSALECPDRGEYFKALVEAGKDADKSFTRIIQLHEKSYDNWVDVIASNDQLYEEFNEIFCKGALLDENGVPPDYPPRNRLRTLTYCITKNRLNVNFLFVDNRYFFMNIATNYEPNGVSDIVAPYMICMEITDPEQSSVISSLEREILMSPREKFKMESNADGASLYSNGFKDCSVRHTLLLGSYKPIIDEAREKRLKSINKKTK
ncbi:hypothetical protein GCE9029_00061 [Grimontia celer]|uniref:Uncharacterized protein n=1 Tax=Grimontia celer TaxID=1796497 RepID=A0A128ET06_9GAMM|nr:hypothetical protein [Grimontia celer]CZF77191.1 hypothetical protein GCE9029_00061 [Grimontia celer]